VKVWLRVVFRLTILAAIGVVAVRLVRGTRPEPTGDGWTDDTPPWTPPAVPGHAAIPAEPASGTAVWVVGDGARCPATHPVKVKLKSGLFHLPGMFAYERTVPDRCYVDEASAAAEGFTKAKR
jgi:hypothetical protein